MDNKWIKIQDFLVRVYEKLFSKEYKTFLRLRKEYKKKFNSDFETENRSYSTIEWIAFMEYCLNHNVLMEEIVGKKMIKYNVHNVADNKKFKMACDKIESNIKDLSIETLIDVDGSIIRTYNSDNGRIEVYNDYEVDAVYIDSEINLDGLFQRT